MLEVVVEREGHEDALVRCCKAATAGEVRRQVEAALAVEADGGEEWELATRDGALHDEDLWLWEEEAPVASVELRLKARWAARRKLAALGVAPTLEAFAAAVGQQDVPLACLLIEAEAVTPRMLCHQLLAACQHGETARALFLLKAHPVLLSHTSFGGLALAALMGFTDLCMALIAAGADVNIGTWGGWTTLMHAAVGGHKALCTALVAKGADVAATTADGKTVLVVAIEECTYDDDLCELCEHLVGLGADVNARSHSGKTPLMYAVEEGRQRELWMVLIRLGADMNAAAEGGDTALAMLAGSAGRTPPSLAASFGMSSEEGDSVLAVCSEDA